MRAAASLTAEFTSVKAINAAIRAHAVGGSGRPVYVKLPGGDLVRVAKARLDAGALKVQILVGRYTWIACEWTDVTT